MASLRRSSLRRFLCRVGLLGSVAPFLLAPAVARADDPPSDGGLDRGQGSIPSGQGGAIVTKPKVDETAPTPGKPELPRALEYVPAVYPPEAEKAGLEGAVGLQLDIDKDGHVTKAIVVDPAGHGFDEAAVEAIQKTRFSPAKKADGTAVASRILYRYSFTLAPKEPPPGDEPKGTEPKTAVESISGTVVITGTDTGLAGAVVTAKSDAGETRAATTDENGHFVLSPLGAGAWSLHIAAPGYDALDLSETLAAGEALELKYRLAPTGDGLEVVVRGERPPREVTKRTLQRQEIDRIPGTNGDALRAIQNLPGVARPPGIAGLLIVRGSAPQDTQVSIDGTPVPLIYHFGGLSSVIPTEMLEKIDFYPGNFSAQYGRAMGGLVDVGLRSPKDDGKYHGLVQLDLIDARAMLEGPVPGLKGWTFLAAGRRSYMDTWLGPALKAAGAGVTQAPVYYDYQFMLQRNLSATSRFRLTFFGSDDGFEALLKDASANEPAITGNIGFHTAFQRLQARYENDLDPQNRIALTAALGRDVIDFGLGPLFFRISANSITGRFEYTHRFGKGVALNLGADVQGYQYDVALRLPPAPRPGEPPNQPFSTRPLQSFSESAGLFLPAAYAEAELTPDPRLRIVPGVRFDYDSFTKRGYASPRVNARFDVAHGYPRTTVKGGVGVFHQAPQAQEAFPPLGTAGLQPNRAIHYELGLEQELSRHVEASGSAFYKQLDDLVVSTSRASGAGLDYSNEGTGKVYGGEFMLKYKPDDRFFGWAAYTISRSTRTDHPGDAERLVPYDQTHILTVLGSYKLGHGWQFGMRFRLVSGNLVTPNVCNPSDPSCDPFRVGGLFHAASGGYTAIPYSGAASERLPLFHQLDMRIDKRWEFKRWQLSAYLDVQNVYNHGNAEGIDYNFNYTARQFVNGLPLLPNIGLRADF